MSNPNEIFPSDNGLVEANCEDCTYDENFIKTNDIDNVAAQNAVAATTTGDYEHTFRLEVFVPANRKQKFIYTLVCLFSKSLSQENEFSFA